MKLITIEKVPEGCMLPRTWICLIWAREKILGFSFYIPWIFHGPYYDPMRRLKRYGWRIPRVLFEIRITSRFLIFRPFYYRWYKTIITFPRLSFYKFYWYEAI